MRYQARIPRAVLGVLGAVAISSSLVMPAFAAETIASVEQEITSGTLTAYIDDAALNDVAYSNNAGLTAGTLLLTVDDARGTSEGWNVSVSSTDFVYGGSSPTGFDIPNTGFSITTANAPTTSAGDNVNVPYAVGGGTLNAAKTTIRADVGNGSGIYEQELDVQLVIPAMSQAGLYETTLTVATSAAP